MKITLTGDESVRLEPTSGPLTIEAPSADKGYSPFHMLGSALATCTFSVLQSYSAHKNLRVDDLIVDVSWTFAEGPHRVGAMSVKLQWPSLPTDMWQRAIRVANLCGIHNTLTHSPTLSIEPVGAQGAAVNAPAPAPTASVGAQADGHARETSSL